MQSRKGTLKVLYVVSFMSCLSVLGTLLMAIPFFNRNWPWFVKGICITLGVLFILAVIVGLIRAVTMKSQPPSESQAKLNEE
jgi:Fe2+ transport system protein B